MFLKNRNIFLCICLIIFILFSYKVYSKTNGKIAIIKYLESLQNFSASFLQNDGESLTEGKIYIGNNRIRAEYLSPVKILIILDENKAMYYNYELEEDEFFNPKNTNAWFFYDIFRNPLFFKDAVLDTKKNQFTIEKSGFDIENRRYFLRVYFENKPLVLRKVELRINDETLTLTIYNHNYNEQFNKNLFKLINPKLLN
tara:strand:+ start:2241 stop:2837 length:597 start_codon:yes stop_codon:yes gene_type:complete